MASFRRVLGPVEHLIWRTMMAEEVQEKNSNDTPADEEEVERRHFHRIVNAYRFYR